MQRSELWVSVGHKGSNICPFKIQTPSKLVEISTIWKLILSGRRTHKPYTQNPYRYNNIQTAPVHIRLHAAQSSTDLC